MKKLVLVLTIALVLVLTSCSEILSDVSIEETISDDSVEENLSNVSVEEIKDNVLDVPYVFFCQGERVSSIPKEDVSLKKATDYEYYKSKYAEYNTYTYFSKLNNSEKLVYRILEYALDNSYTNIFFDKKLTENTNYSVEDILFMFSLDSPFVEQNIVKYSSEFSCDVNVGNNYTGEINGPYLYVENFSNDKLSKKEKALEKAQNILDDIPNALTPAEKAEYIYRYLGENITYRKYDEDQERNYIYDALCIGVTHCDGFANAFSLLCNMAKIPCVEKMYLQQTNEDEGHTWNVLFLNNLWYNADVTNYNAMIPELPRFGFPDSQQSREPLYSNLTPLCKESLVEADFVFDVCETDFDIEKISNAFITSDNRYLTFSMKELPDNPEAFIQKLANNIDFSFSYVIYGGFEEYVYCLYVKDNYD